MIGIKKIRTFIKNYYHNSFKFEPDFIQEYISNNFLYNRIGHFHPHYKEWTMRRINKIIEIFPIEDFKNKKVLILGDGIGNFSIFFASMGADVLVLEGRIFNINFAKLRTLNLKDKKIKFEQFDLNKNFTKFGKFDFIINFGFVEVISDLNNLLECCAKMSSIIILETVVCDSLDKDYIGYRRLLNTIDCGLTDKVCRPSPFFIEDFFASRGLNIERYFDANLNTDPSVLPHHIYNWKHKDDKSIDESHRRFWMFRKSK